MKSNIPKKEQELNKKLFIIWMVLRSEESDNKIEKVQ